jgi:hypothetical protein
MPNLAEVKHDCRNCVYYDVCPDKGPDNTACHIFEYGFECDVCHIQMPDDKKVEWCHHGTPVMWVCPACDKRNGFMSRRG